MACTCVAVADTIKFLGCVIFMKAKVDVMFCMCPTIQPTSLAVASRQSRWQAIAMKKSMKKGQEETGGLGACTQKKFGVHARHLERWKMPFCKIGCKVLSSFIFMLRGRNCTPIMFSSNFDDKEQSGKSYAGHVCTP